MASNNVATMIQISDLEFRYPQGDFKLSIPSLRVEGGERVGVIGPSGSGKTTLLHLIAGITSPAAGSVETGGTALARLDDASRREFRIRRIGLVFQEFELIEYLDVLDNILLPYRINSALHLDGAVRDRAVALARRVGLADALRRSSTQLSQGEKQRVAVCRALITEPDLLLADEPTGNLDPANKDRVLAILVDYAEERGATLVTVTHDHDLLDRFGRVIDFKSFYSGAAVEPESGT
jgi:ABC-type lipoprotein export system ATPase subunit